MTKTQRKQIGEIADRLSAIQSELETLHSDLESKYDEKSETWQEGDAGCAAREVVDSLDSAKSDVESALDNVNNIQLED